MHHVQDVSGATVHHCIHDVIRMRHMMMELAKPSTFVTCRDKCIDCSITQNKEDERKRRTERQWENNWSKNHKRSCSRTLAFIPNVISCRPCILVACGHRRRRHSLNPGHGYSSCLSFVSLSLCHWTPAQPQSCPQRNITQWLPLCSLEGTFPSKLAPSHTVFCTR